MDSAAAPRYGVAAMDAAFPELARQYVDEAPALAPTYATWLGDHRFDGQLDHVGRAATERHAAFCRTYQERLGRIARAALSRADQVDAAILEHHLRSERWHLEELQEWAWNPMFYTGLAGGAIYNLMARDFAPLAERLNHVADRLAEFPRLMGEVRETLDPARVPKVHAETAVKQNPGVLGILEGMVRPRLGEMSSRDQARLVAAMETARAAVDAQQRWLETDLLPHAAGEFRLGAARYDAKLAFALQSPLGRREIRARAEAELARTTEEMYEIAARCLREQGDGSSLPARPSHEEKLAAIRSALEIAYGQVPPHDGIVEAARASLAELTDFVRRADLVTLPSDPVEVIVMPEFQRGVALAYCDSPGPLDAGQRTFYAIAPLPADWTEEQVRSFLREYNVRSLHNLTVHEAMPGHYVQLAHSNRYPSKLRAILASGPFIEGWAVYAEGLMADHGVCGGDPLARLVVLKWRLRGILNALLDQAVHVDGMTRESAMALLTGDGFQEEREAAGKWTRAQLTSAQLATYFVGYQEHVDLCREVQAAWGAGFTARRYHDTVLSFGSPPTQYVRALMLDLPIKAAGGCCRS